MAKMEIGAQLLRVLVAFAKDLGSVPSTQMVIRDPTLFFLSSVGSHVVHTQAHAGITINPGTS